LGFDLNFFPFNMRLLVLLAIPLTVYLLRPQMDERWYARYRALPTAVPYLTGQPSESLESQAIATYNLKRYTAALPLWSQLTDSTIEGCQARMMAGICLLELNRMREAEEHFNLMISGQAACTVAQQLEAQWFLALSKLRRHDRRGAKAILANELKQSSRAAQAEELAAKIW
jgi:predicted Zn-dependent protease